MVCAGRPHPERRTSTPKVRPHGSRIRDVLLRRCHESIISSSTGIREAHLDQVTHARPLVDALGRRSVSCWVDEAELLPGVSLMDAISEGLTSAHFVVVLITENFLQRNWTQRELNAALSR